MARDHGVESVSKRQRAHQHGDSQGQALVPTAAQEAISRQQPIDGNQQEGRIDKEDVPPGIIDHRMPADNYDQRQEKPGQDDQSPAFSSVEEENGAAQQRSRRTDQARLNRAVYSRAW